MTFDERLHLCSIDEVCSKFFILADHTGGQGSIESDSENGVLVARTAVLLTSIASIPNTPGEAIAKSTV